MSDLLTCKYCHVLPDVQCERSGYSFKCPCCDNQTMNYSSEEQAADTWNDIYGFVAAPAAPPVQGEFVEPVNTQTGLLDAEGKVIEYCTICDGFGGTGGKCGGCGR